MEHVFVFSLNAGKFGPEQLRIRTRFTQCVHTRFNLEIKRGGHFRKTNNERLQAFAHAEGLLNTEGGPGGRGGGDSAVIPTKGPEGIPDRGCYNYRVTDVTDDILLFILLYVDFCFYYRLYFFDFEILCSFICFIDYWTELSVA